MDANSCAALRQALIEIEPSPASEANLPPAIRDIYTPPDHESALDPDRPLVVGGRGVGKSFWTSVLVDEAAREAVADFYPNLSLRNYTAALGFAGVDTPLAGPPSKEILDDLVGKDNYKLETIWRAVVLRNLTGFLEFQLPSNWRGDQGLVAWADENSERLQNTLREADDRLQQAGRKILIVFDALDRLGDTWGDIRERTRALLKVTLAMRSYRNIKIKIFMRADQAEDHSLTAFPDASKLLGSRVDLAWSKTDLYGLLFFKLAKHPVAGTVFQALVADRLGLYLKSEAGAIPLSLMSNATEQEMLFSAIAGPYMGADHRKGRTYSWIHNHLADAFGRVSPRTFLAAIRVAGSRGSNTQDRVIDAQGLQAGLQAASNQRVTQLSEEFGWIRNALEPLADLRVPCDEPDLFQRWRDANTIKAIRKAAKDGTFLEPVEFNEAIDDQLSLFDAMRRIGVAERRPDQRVNIPDIYRIAAKLLRKGGVPPERSIR